MFKLSQDAPGSVELLSGNEAIGRGALEAGVRFCAGYPGTPSSEIIDSLAPIAKGMDLYVEWSTNEKVATEAAAAASFAGLRSIATMKNAGINVAMDFLQHHNLSGIGEKGGGMVVVVCDDPGGYSSSDEQDTRWLAKSADVPLLVAGDVQEAKELMKWAFELSEKFKCYCLFRSYTRLSHAAGGVKLGALPRVRKQAAYDTSYSVTPETPYIVELHAKAHQRLDNIREVYESSPFNSYEGPEEPELLIITSGSGCLCAPEAVDLLNLKARVGVLRIATVWPMPTKLLERYLSRSKQALVVEDTDPFIEVHVKEVVADSCALSGRVIVHGRRSGHIAHAGEITTEAIINALGEIFEANYVSRSANYAEEAENANEKMMVNRGAIWCPGCPHRASFWAMSRALKKFGGNGFAVGDVGCYTLDIWPAGYNVTKLLHGMGSSAGLGSGFGKLRQFGFKQPVIAVCGDSTFYHSITPALVNAIYNKSNLMVVVVDNGATAMTGFQPHPGTGFNVMGEAAPIVDIAEFCRALGCSVKTIDPFEIDATVDSMVEFLGQEGVRVLVLRRSCELARKKSERKVPYRIYIDEEKCKGLKCSLCTKLFACPGLTFDRETGKAQIVDGVCSGCGVCVDICPHHAISKEMII